MKRTPELLAPAGNMEKLKVALAYGADAVYLSGKTYGLRAGSDNFSPEQLEEAVSYVHTLGKKCYLAVNIFAHPGDFLSLDEELLFYDRIGADALIVSDPGIFRRCRILIPDMELHISTQANVTNAQSCLFWYEQGARRIVLARELSLDEIGGIRRGIPDDLLLECFVHGAMCMSYSGRCLLSNHFSGRGANQGNCSQPCRWKYEICEEKRPDEPLIAQEDNRGTYLFNSRDISMIDYIPELIKAGIDSFKIEGRVKGAFYAAVTTWAYKNALKTYQKNPEHYTADPLWKLQLERTVHRQFGTGFYFDRPGKNAQIFPEKTYLRPAFVVGVVQGYDPEAGLLSINQRNKMTKGEILSVIQPDGAFDFLTITEIYDAKKNRVASTSQANQTYFLACDKPYPPYSFLSADGDKDIGSAK